MKANKKKNQIQKLVSIRKIAERLNSVTVKNILFIHAWSGWDATLTIYIKGKTTRMKLIVKGDRDVLNICSTFEKTDSTLDEIGKPELNCL